MKESEIQSKIIKKLESLGYYTVKIIQCNKNGFPDIIAMKEGNVICVEVKTDKGVLSELQKYRIIELGRHGVCSIVARSVKDLNEIL